MTEAVGQPDCDTAGRPSTTIDTEYTPCSLEFCPARPRLGACGFYQTQQKEQPTATASDSPQVERIGRCVLFEASLDVDQGHGINYQQLQSFDCPAVLDQRWTQDPRNPILITADAQGDLNSYKLNDPFGDSPRLDRLHTFDCCPTKKDVLCLSLDISDKQNKSASPKIVCSLSNGQVVLLSQHSSSHSSAGLVEERRWDAHLYEPWTCAFDYWQPETVFTGGDDCQLKVWDTRDTLHRPVLVNKQFDGGVTAIRSDHLRDHVVAVGSYDSRLRIFDKRNMSRPILEEDCGGGIWRIKWDDRVTGRLLLATMHGGFRVLQISEHQPKVGVEEDSPRLSASVASSFTHRSGLAYGADWTPLLDHNHGVVPQDSEQFSPSTQLIGGCSFYDRALHFWTLDSHTYI
ncbi:hypothetical protein PGT21_013712 [Puccinia graminis f. sp. tritici]|uniref:methylated diphthine methylhydrolase n=1 Tax=Puccinia graminis f. sp. tritici TaxID=56615 RepID=A0A5B0PRM2_PUCGR|nr:hypothetical protein PGT21_013712 [Puccinia graminis f. sp. tritici]